MDEKTSRRLWDLEDQLDVLQSRLDSTIVPREKKELTKRIKKIQKEKEKLTRKAP